MCTVTWWQHPESFAYEVFFNRDEQHSRGDSTPPTIACSRGLDYLAPADIDHGGTWLLVNVHGVSLALLNCYPDDPALPEAPRSRGKLLRDLADAASVTAVATRLAREDVSCYSAFFLLAFGRGEKPRQWVWDTYDLQGIALPENLPILTSSSHLSDKIEQHRRELFVREYSAPGRLEPEHLAQFHQHREPHRPAYGILMDRPDSRTLSISRLQVGPGPEAVFTYQARPFHDGVLPEPAIITRLNLSSPAPAS
jgi:hypothetical protein